MDDDDGSTAILLGALWDRKERSSNHNDNSQTGYVTQLGSFRTIPDDHLDSNARSPADHSRHLKVRPINAKRQRSPAIGSTNDSSNWNRIKRQPPEVRLKGLSRFEDVGPARWWFESSLYNI